MEEPVNYEYQEMPVESWTVRSVNRVTDDAGDEHLAHVSCLSHRCRITTDRSAAQVAVAFAVVAVLT